MDWNHGLPKPTWNPLEAWKKLRGRHGTTTWNLAKRWQGQQDTELAPEGIAQAEERSVKPNSPFDEFFAEGKRVDKSIEPLYVEILHEFAWYLYNKRIYFFDSYSSTYLSYNTAYLCIYSRRYIDICTYSFIYIHFCIYTVYVSILILWNPCSELSRCFSG